MDITLNKPILSGKLPAISSKSEAHRALICAALSDRPTKIKCTYTNNDIDATASSLNALGANIERRGEYFSVYPISKVTQNATLDVGESGSTLRFIIPIIAALGINAKINMHGRLPMRPLSPLYELLCDNGVSISPMGSNPLVMSGKLSAGNYSIKANVSSQFISGLLFALPLCDGDSTLTLVGNIESKNYIDMTLDAQKSFGYDVKFENNTFYIKGIGKYTSPSQLQIMGDWSNAAFFLSAGAIGKHPIELTGLDVNSSQGDKEILCVLKRMGACVEITSHGVKVSPGALHGIDIDASQIPDLVPIIASVASVANGRTRIYNASRLRLKESDRIESVCKMISALGGNICATDDGMIIDGIPELCGGEVDSFADHRISMSAAICSTVCNSSVCIHGFESINKSYPDFLNHLTNINISK